MLRYLFVFINVLPFMFLFNTTEVKKEELKVELIVPASAEPGSEFKVQLKITGGDVTGFAKYTDRIPEGIEAEAVELGDATFTADNGQVKIIWLEYPKADEVIVEYKMKVKETTTGSIQIGGKFSYLENNEKRVFSVFKKTINIGDQQEEAVTESKEEKAKEVSVNVSRRVVSSKENVHKIEVRVNQTGIADFGKIQEYVPMGAKIEEGETENAAFSSIKNKVKFVWMSIPKKESFIVSYYIDLTDAENKDIQSITGNFSYLDNTSASQKVEINFGASDPVLASSSSTTKENKNTESSIENAKDEVAQSVTKTTQKPSESVKTEEKIAVVTPAVAAGTSTVANAKKQSENKVAANENNENEAMASASSSESDNLDDVFAESGEDKAEEKITAVEKEEQPVVAVDEVVEENVAKVESKSTKKEEEKESEKQKDDVAVTSTPKVKPVSTVNANPVATGVKYRVQIAAGANVVDAAYFKSRHNFESTFNIENHEGWVKYTTGSFSMYKDARDSRESINGSGYDFDGPFVTAYNNGDRITVQEALMISSQKWYK